jgi:ribosomal protein RSM22 (predicted rRNA methylase)
MPDRTGFSRGHFADKVATMTAPSYPIQLEQWWLDQARKLTGIADLVPCMASMEKDVERLSDLFTLDRAAKFGDYARDERMLLAYGLFFFPQTFIRVQLVLEELSGFRLPSFRPRRILDLGCGSGAATFAALMHFRESQMEARAVDASSPFLDIAEKLFKENRTLWPNASLSVETGDLFDFRGEESWDLILVSFALNEAMESRTEDEAKTWLRRWLDRLAPGGVLLILEPVSQATSERLERLRNWVSEHKVARILGPCLHHASCPLLNKGELWCHEVRRWRIPETLQVLNRRLFRSIEDLKFSFLMLERTEAPDGGTAGPDVFRMIAPMRKMKGKLVTAGCAADGGARTYEMLTRGLDRPAEDDLISFERGSIVRSVGLQPLADGKTLRARNFERVFEPSSEK